MESGYLDRRQQQREAALLTANQVRIAQAELKRRIKDGRVDPLRALEGKDEMWSDFVTHLKLGVFLRFIPRFGRETVEEILRDVGLYSNSRLRDQPAEVRARVLFLVRMLLERE